MSCSRHCEKRSDEAIQCNPKRFLTPNLEIWLDQRRNQSLPFIPSLSKDNSRLEPCFGRLKINSLLCVAPI